MEAVFSDEQNQFRQEVRDWLNANVPSERLPSLDTQEGFDLHREWERKLHAGNWGMVTCPDLKSRRRSPKLHSFEMESCVFSGTRLKRNSDMRYVESLKEEGHATGNHQNLSSKVLLVPAPSPYLLSGRLPEKSPSN